MRLAGAVLCRLADQRVNARCARIFLIYHQRRIVGIVHHHALLPGVRVNTSPANHHPLRQMQLQRWDGKGYVRLGGIIEGATLNAVRNIRCLCNTCCAMPLMGLQPQPRSSSRGVVPSPRLEGWPRVR